MAMLTALITVAIIFSFSTIVQCLTATLDESCAVAATPPTNYGVTPTRKGYNESCTSNSECNKIPAMICSNSLCQCMQPYALIVYPTGSMACVYTATMNMPCSDTTPCRAPLQCQDTPTAVPTTTPHGMYRYYSYGLGGKRCQCIEPYKLDKSGNCVRDCQTDELATPDLMCHKRCQQNEIMCSNYECKSMTALGAACETNVQCESPFSECANKTCSCRKGFVQESGSCVATAANCDFGAPLRSTTDSSPVTCNVTQSSVTYYQSPSDNSAPQIRSTGISVLQSSTDKPPTNPILNGKDKPCPTNYYCQPYDTARGSMTNGICCPDPPTATPLCPVGEPHPTAKCPNGYGGGVTYQVINGMLVPQTQTQTNTESCPGDTHYCYASVTTMYNPNNNGQCCPRECSRDTVSVNQKCIPLVPMGQKCQYEAQCSHMYADCINGTCACPPKTTEQNSNGQSICTASCDSYTEMAINNRCYPRLKIGDQCKNQPSNCPLSAFCNPQGICQCPCNMMAIDNTICAPPPVCPSVNGTTSAPAYYFQTRKPMSSDYEGKTFCRLPGRSPGISEAVDFCPDNQFCNVYSMMNLGVCCQKPEPSCPYTSNVYESCGYNGGTTVASTTCRDGHFCHQYVYDYGRQTGSSVCCDNYPTAPRPMTTQHPSTQSHGPASNIG